MRKKLYMLLTTVVMLLGLMTVTAAAEDYYWPVADSTGRRAGAEVTTASILAGKIFG